MQEHELTIIGYLGCNMQGIALLEVQGSFRDHVNTPVEMSLLQECAWWLLASFPGPHMKHVPRVGLHGYEARWLHSTAD